LLKEKKACMPNGHCIRSVVRIQQGSQQCYLKRQLFQLGMVFLPQVK